MKSLQLFLFSCFLFLLPAAAQEKISRKQFFSDTSVVSIDIETDMKKLYGQKKAPAFQPGKITWYNADSSGDLSENIKIRLRGNYRRENCGVASLMVEFRDSAGNSRLKNLKNLKLVAPCGRGFEFEQLVIKEFLVYKIYNELTNMSFRVRLLKLTLKDINKKSAPSAQFAFAIEPVDDVGKRNNCVEEDEKKFFTEQTDREHTTLVAMFQYMIANTDWSIPVYHNIKLLIDKDSASKPPFVVPYDFDYCGLVNAPYAVPHESTGLVSVTERLYMGFPRSIEEIKAAAEIFKSKKEKIFALINSTTLLSGATKTSMINYLDEFYEILEHEQKMKAEFINNARKK